MDEQGGDPNAQNNNPSALRDDQYDQPQKVSTNYINSKMAITIIVMVGLCIIFVATLVVVGMLASRSEVVGGPESRTAQEPVKVAHEEIKVEHTEESIDYNPDINKPAGARNSLMARYGVNDAEYVILRNPDELAAFVDAINSTFPSNRTPFKYSLDSDFFKTGAVVALAKEDEGLMYTLMGKIFNDENDTLHIDGAYYLHSKSKDMGGEVYLIRIKDAQPKAAELTWHLNGE